MALQQTIGLDELLSSLNDRVKIKLERREEEMILKKLPPTKNFIKYERVYQISGKHYPCIHNAIPDLAQRVQMKKSESGKIVTFVCKTAKEARDAVDSINDELGNHGYTAHSNENTVIFNTSTITSLSPLLSSRGCRVLYCEHSRENEIITFGKEEGQDDCDLRSIIEKAEKRATQKTKRTVIFPKKIISLGSNITLPDCELYNPKFIKFLIKEHPTDYQLKTYLSLYHLAELGIPVPYIQERHLIRIIHAYYDVPLKSLEKHLLDAKIPLQARFAKLFTTDELHVSIHVDFLLMRNKSGISTLDV